MPNQARKENPARAVRVEDDLWHAAQATAAERGETVSEVVRRALTRLAREQRETPAPPQQVKTTRAIRVEDELWQAALLAAADRGEPVSEVVRRALQRYARSRPAAAEGES